MYTFSIGRKGKGNHLSMCTLSMCRKGKGNYLSMYTLSMDKATSFAHPLLRDPIYTEL